MDRIGSRTVDAPGPYLDLYPSTPLDGTQPYPSEMHLNGVKALEFWSEVCTRYFFKQRTRFFLKKNDDKMASSKPDETKPEVCDPLTYPTYAGSVDTKVTVGGTGTSWGRARRTQGR